mmetsp:Transcript_3510/g.8177  ORF Transcript_3510/g.8177 Transcript_3510/m.8177 type:complete len:344 (-) Transcript_3510:96-1127(-)|eukprot:CAMPEP_0171080280 /NCGR_PEP_ID=MMETSP0766_2-20121228/15768_1 /TAXON_ID=439317 /ORGANISM="Gambierdiscus australes, Strain CAWD 149" /LENGTH=343 /DNA_ID=CAMNT_0011537503 /DNA_START=52 /DNA_END=1083 /DNA_ORIENTATION=+
MSGGAVWRVVGGGEKGGIVVREGKDLKSKEAAERLATGSLIQEVELVGERLSYELKTGSGPSKGWVSLKLKDKDLVVKADQGPALPVLACFYSGGMTSAQGRGQLKHWLAAAEKEGFTDTVVLDHIGEEGYADCKDFADYTSRLKQALDGDPKLRDRPVCVVAHSHGTVPAWGLARLLGDRVLKLYVLTRRPPNGALLDETWGVDSASKVADLDEEFMLKRMIEAWPNDFLFQHKDKSPLPPMVKKIMEVVKRQYCSPCFPCGSADVSTIVGDDPTIPAPIMGLAAEQEAEPKGETASKMQGWRDFTAGSFDLVTVPGVDHMGIMGPMSPAFEIMLKDIKTLI